jgi:hypothetical protein
MRTTTSNDITRTEALSDAALEQVAGGFCVTPPAIGLPVFPPVTLPWPPPKSPGSGPDPIPPRLPPLPKRPSPVKDAESMLPDLRWDAR